MAPESLAELPKTKIVATVGPASATREKLAALIGAGVSVFRLNFSHGTHDDHARVLQLIRTVSREADRPVGVLGDLSGPKLRLGDVDGGGRQLVEGDEIRLTSASDADGRTRFRVTFPDAHMIIKPGKPILLDDGTIRLAALRIEGEDVVCRVQNSAVIKPRKGVNLPDTALPIPALTDKDRLDLAFGLAAGIDFVALSFVRSASDVALCRAAMKECGRTVPLIAKIEKSEAVDNLDAILGAADGAMVARGDLGVEIPVQKVPSVQRRILRACNLLGKPAITATQMLNTMITEPMPTRAEVTDIYNAILQGTDAVMLSGETASGKYPVESVAMMCQIALEAGRDMGWTWDGQWIHESATTWSETLAEAVAEAAVTLARRLELHAIICPTVGGTTARRLARYRPRCPILAFSTSESTVSRLSLSWGVRPRLLGHEECDTGDGSAVIRNALRTAWKAGLVREGNRVVVVAGLPLSRSGLTNALRVIEIHGSELNCPTS
ncbi:MAG: pyruvate kinase [Candidatus Sumerlaeota bacterium]|nr:pyruvate kinase [Candidatus Sumerlaeota bacterium]